MKVDKLTYFYPEKPSLISIDQPLFQMVSDMEDFVAERKYNGSRLQLHYFENKFQFWNRHGQKFSYRPSDDLMDALHSLGLNGYWLFDGELRHNKVKGLQNKIMFYDVFVAENDFQLKVPFRKRREILESIFNIDEEPIGLTRQFSSDFKSVYTEVIEDDEIEGLVMKDLNGTLNLGRKAGISSEWMYKVRRPSNSYKF